MIRNNFSPAFFYFILAIFLLGCSDEGNHWEVVAEFQASGQYIVLDNTTETNWINQISIDMPWLPASLADTTKITSNQILIASLTFNYSTTDSLFAALLRSRHDVPFEAYLNGVLIAQRYKNQYVPSFVNPLNNDFRTYIYAYYRPKSFILETDEIEPLLIAGTNFLHVVISDEKVRLKDLNDFSLSFGIRGGKTLFSSKRPHLKHDGVYKSGNLPVIKIETNNQPIVDEPKVKAKLAIQRDSINGIEQQEFKIGIELRGHTAQQIMKKSFGISIRQLNDSLTHFIGLPIAKKWVLYGPYLDKTLLRNAFAYSIYKRMGHYSPQFRFCELFINNDYQGIYMLCDKLEFGANRIPGEPADGMDSTLTGLDEDFLLEIDRGKKTSWYSSYKSNFGMTISYEYENPVYEELNPKQQQYLKAFVDSFETTVFQEKLNKTSTEHLKYINPNTFYDYIILNELSRNIDAYRLSTFLVKRGISRGGKLEAGPVWDYNLAFGLSSDLEGYNPQGFVYVYDANIPFWWTVLIENENFSAGLKSRYTELRNSTLQYDSLMFLWNELENEIAPSLNNNFTKWPVLNKNDFWPNHFTGKNYNDECDYLKSWLKQRIDWLDKQWLRKES
jgi:hypothetical protein